MNKSAEAQAEEYEKEQLKEIRFFPLPSQAFIAGHQSRDEEVKKLVEVLKELSTRPIYITSYDPNYSIGARIVGVNQDMTLFDKAKEALKPYQK